VGIEESSVCTRPTRQRTSEEISPEFDRHRVSFSLTHFQPKRMIKFRNALFREAITVFLFLGFLGMKGMKAEL
jgi:hypothetical protein